MEQATALTGGFYLKAVGPWFRRRCRGPPLFCAAAFSTEQGNDPKLYTLGSLRTLRSSEMGMFFFIRMTWTGRGAASCEPSFFLRE